MGEVMYTTEELIQIISDYLDQADRVSKTSFAKYMGISRFTLNNIVKGKYDGKHFYTNNPVVRRVVWNDDMYMIRALFANTKPCRRLRNN